MATDGTLSSAWDQHLAAEFAAKSPEQALATMTAEPYVNLVPLMFGACGREELYDFYANHFLNQIPPDLETVPVSRTVGQGRVVDEMILRFTHSIRLDWVLPGIAPTGRRVEIPLIAVVQLEGDKVAHEHIYWDQASVLVQVGLLDRALPVRGGEIAAQVLNPTQPMNELIRALNKPRQPDPFEWADRSASRVMSGRHDPARFLNHVFIFRATRRSTAPSGNPSDTACGWRYEGVSTAWPDGVKPSAPPNSPAHPLP